MKYNKNLISYWKVRKWFIYKSCLENGYFVVIVHSSQQILFLKKFVLKGFEKLKNWINSQYEKRFRIYMYAM